MSTPRVLIIHTGGTFGMMPLPPSATLAPSDIQDLFKRFLPELHQIARLEVETLFNLDSADIQVPHWQKLARCIFQHLDDFDGFVLIHGTDSMVYTAAALSFMLANLPKPVILTGSQRPLSAIRSDARSNLINAVELATYPIPEVGIFFGTHLLRGNRSIKYSTTDFEAFRSPNYPPLATVGVDIRIHWEVILSPPEQPPRLHPSMSQTVQVLRYFPGMSAQPLLQWREARLQAVVLEALGMGNVAVQEPALLQAVKTLTRTGKILAVTSQCLHGGVDLSRYANGRALQEAGAIGLADMTTETAIVKLMHLLGTYSQNPALVREKLLQPLAGEVTPPAG